MKGGTHRELSRRVVPEWQLSGIGIYTQRLYLASPRGTYLAHAGDADGALRVRDRRGRERIIEDAGGRDLRFSPDERHLAAVREGAAGSELIVVELATGVTRSLGASDPEWMEWVSGGLVTTEHPHPGQAAALLVHHPLDGERRVLTEASASMTLRFTTARRGTRVMFFDDGRIRLLDVDQPDQAPLDVGELPSAVANVEMTPDGSEAAIHTFDGLYRWTATGLAKIDPDSTIHSLWYSADGSQLAYASTEGATVLAGDKAYRFDAGDVDLRAMRFRTGSSGLILAVGDRAIWWQPLADTRRTLARAASEESLEGVEVFRGGTVLWTRRMTDKTELLRGHAQNGSPNRAVR